MPTTATINTIAAMPATPAMPTQLDAGAFYLRPLETGDSPACVQAVRESAATVGRWMSWAHAAYADDDALAWIAHCATARQDGSSHEYGIFDAASRTLVGSAGLNQFNAANGFCNLGYWVRESCQRRGAASSAVRALLPLAFGALGQGRVEIVMAVGNVASRAVAQRAGALEECVARNRLKLHGRFVDAHVFSLVPPPAPWP